MLVLLGISFAFAQGTYGVRGGLNLANYTGDAGLDNKIGFHAGMMMEYKINPLLLIQPELLYTQRGTHQDKKILGVQTKTDNTLHYVELPIFLKASVGIGDGDFKIEPYLGPEFRYLAKGKWSVKAGSSETSGDFDSDDVKAFDYGLGFGLDLRFHRNMLLGARYSMGMAEPFKNSDAKNTAIMVNLGYIY